MKNKTVYTVNVGNIGNIEYTNKKLAIDCFKTYRSLSMQNITRCAGESVYLMEGDNILMEYIGTIDLVDNDL